MGNYCVGARASSEGFFHSVSNSMWCYWMEEESAADEPVSVNDAKDDRAEPFGAAVVSFVSYGKEDVKVQQLFPFSEKEEARADRPPTKQKKFLHAKKPSSAGLVEHSVLRSIWWRRIPHLASD